MPIMRNKTRIVAYGKEPDIWGFDGSSTNEAPGSLSDCALRPVYTCPDPIRSGENILVLLGWPETGFPRSAGSVLLQCRQREVGRELVERHTKACLDASLAIEGTNAEVMMAQWEFQIGVLPAPLIADQM